MLADFPSGSIVLKPHVLGSECPYACLFEVDISGSGLMELDLSKPLQLELDFSSFKVIVGRTVLCKNRTRSMSVQREAKFNKFGTMRAIILQGLKVLGFALEQVSTKSEYEWSFIVQCVKYAMEAKT